ncbi:HYR domain-containing protein [Streptomyces anulatus]|uniref:HYR domain-containing protein n=1 Tax=Streptomyces TaxID=1883 RepID=UPI0015CF7273|nr:MULTISPECIES: HYR domain-containing protein [Streptomyces]MBT1099644.1 HYR domain-containing protein [Streptomyces sp. Tu10]WTC72149.1 HYR domain-containing protein [Streptomyces anulatus]WUC88266.1 HYR domain-containing protein [Streptomyces anulatus]
MAAGLAPASGVSGVASAVPVPEPWVTPATLEETLDPGGSTGVDKQVRTPAIPPRPDVVLLVDGTASMADPIRSVRENLPAITGKILAEQPDSHFAVATFGDQEGDVNAGFQVLTGLTDDLVKVQEGVDKLKTDLGGASRGPSEDWINGLWQIADGAGGTTVFRDGSSPVVVLVGDASSHSPSNGHTIDDTIFALQDKGVRVIGVDVESTIGDGLNGNGDAGNPDYVEDPPTTPGQATRIIEATGGRLLGGIDGDRVAEAIIEGFDNLPTSVGYRLDACDPHLTVALDPPTRQLTSGETAHFAETVDVSEDAPQGTTLTCTVQFLLGTQVPGTDTIGPAAVPDPDFQQQISIAVNDIDVPVVTVDDRTARAPDDDGARIEYTATATDPQDGALPVTCTPPSGSLFPVGTTTVTCSATDSAGNTGADTARFEVLEPVVPPDPPTPPPPPPPASDIAVRADVSPDRTYVGRPATARFTITNAGPDTATGVVLGTVWPRTGESKDRSLTGPSRCTAARPCTIAAGGRIEVTQTATYRAAVTGDVRATVRGTLPDGRRANNRDADRLRVLKPSLTVTPQVAKPGQPVLARGKDFPPGETVRFTWNIGITADRSGVRVGRDGTFEVQVLVLRKDTLGPRVLRAEARDLPRLRKPVLVVQHNLQPPDFAGRS